MVRGRLQQSLWMVFPGSEPDGQRKPLRPDQLFAAAQSSFNSRVCRILPPMLSECIIRSKLDSESDPNWTPIPIQAGRVIRGNLDTCGGLLAPVSGLSRGLYRCVVLAGGSGAVAVSEGIRQPLNIRDSITNRVSDVIQASVYAGD